MSRKLLNIWSLPLWFIQCLLHPLMLLFYFFPASQYLCSGYDSFSFQPRRATHLLTWREPVLTQLEPCGLKWVAPLDLRCLLVAFLPQPFCFCCKKKKNCFLAKAKWNPEFKLVVPVCVDFKCPSVFALFFFYLKDNWTTSTGECGLLLDVLILTIKGRLIVLGFFF